MTLAASNFTSFVEWLNRSGILYFIAWGYEKLPDQKSGGDIDMYVHPDHYLKVAEMLRDMGYMSARCPLYNENHMHEQFVKTGRHPIDLFSSLCFNFMGKHVYLTIPPNQILHGRTKMGNLWIPSPLVETLFTALRVIGGRKEPNCIKRIEKHIGR